MRKFSLAAVIFFALCSVAPAAQALMGVSNLQSWVPNPSNPPDIAINWALNQAWTPATGVTTPAALGVTTTRSTVKQVVDSGGNYTQAPVNTTAISNLGRLTEEARTNGLRNNSGTGAVVGVARTVVSITSLSRSASATAVAAASGTNVAVGDLVTITGASVAAYNGNFIVSAASAGVSFSYVTSGSATDSATSATYTAISPGTLPTNWAITSLGLAPCVVGTGIVNGVNYVDFRLAGLTSSTFASIFMEASSTIAATNSQTWAVSLFEQLVAGSTTNITSRFADIRQQDSGGVTLTDLLAVNSFSPSGTLTRVVGSATTNNASIAFIRPYIGLSWASGSVIDITLRVGWPQVEIGTYSSSPIATSSGALTRSADVTSIPVTVGSAYTLYEKATPQAPTAFANIQEWLDLNDATAANSSRIYRASATGNDQAAMLLSSSFATGSPFGATALTQSVSAKLAASFAANAQAVSLNGAAAVTATAVTLPTGVTTLNLGSRGDGTLQLNGTATIDAIWLSKALSTADLQAITQ